MATNRSGGYTGHHQPHTTAVSDEPSTSSGGNNCNTTTTTTNTNNNNDNKNNNNSGIDTIEESESEAATMEMLLRNLPSNALAVHTPDPRLERARLEVARTNQITPVLKEELRLRIMAKRMERGEPEIETFPAEPRRYELTIEEQMKRERRKAQNREAAKRCREKRKRKQLSEAEASEQIREENQRLTKEMEKLSKRHDFLKRMYDQHLAGGHCRLDVVARQQRQQQQQQQQQQHNHNHIYQQQEQSEQQQAQLSASCCCDSQAPRHVSYIPQQNGVPCKRPRRISSLVANQPASYPAPMSPRQLETPPVCSEKSSSFATPTEHMRTTGRTSPCDTFTICPTVFSPTKDTICQSTDLDSNGSTITRASIQFTTKRPSYTEDIGSPYNNFTDGHHLVMNSDENASFQSRIGSPITTPITMRMSTPMVTSDLVGFNAYTKPINNNSTSTPLTANTVEGDTPFTDDPPSTVIVSLSTSPTPQEEKMKMPVLSTADLAGIFPDDFSEVSSSDTSSLELNPDVLFESLGDLSSISGVSHGSKLLSESSNGFEMDSSKSTSSPRPQTCTSCSTSFTSLTHNTSSDSSYRSGYERASHGQGQSSETEAQSFTQGLESPGSTGGEMDLCMQAQLIPSSVNLASCHINIDLENELGVINRRSQAVLSKTIPGLLHSPETPASSPALICSGTSQYHQHEIIYSPPSANPTVGHGKGVDQSYFNVSLGWAPHPGSTKTMQCQMPSERFLPKAASMYLKARGAVLVHESPSNASITRMTMRRMSSNASSFSTSTTTANQSMNSITNLNLVASSPFAYTTQLSTSSLSPPPSVPSPSASSSHEIPESPSLLTGIPSYTEEGRGSGQHLSPASAVASGLTSPAYLGDISGEDDD